MATHLDLIASFFIGGMLLLMLLNMNAGLVACTNGTGLSQITQLNALGTAEIITWDLKRAGLRVPAPALAFLSASPEAFTFRGDVNSDGAVDTVTYILALGGVPSTPNPNDRMLYRRVGLAPPQRLSSGIIGFDVTYRDSLGAVITAPVPADSLAVIRSVDIALDVESTESYGDEYARFFLEFSVRPKSL